MNITKNVTNATRVFEGTGKPPLYILRFKHHTGVIIREFFYLIITADLLGR